MKLDRNAAERAIKAVIADPLGISTEDAAFGIHAIVNENMATAAKAYVSEKGESPNSCALVGFGGAGPVHSCDLAARLGIDTVLIPPRAGVAAAFGMIVAPVSYDAIRSRRILLGSLEAEALTKVWHEMAFECRERLPKSVDLERVEFEFSVDMRYVGQGYEVNAVLDSRMIDAGSIADLQASFESAYRKLYGRTYSGTPLEIMNFRLSATTSRRVADVRHDASGPASDGRTGQRRAFCPRMRTWCDFSIHRRESITPGSEFHGPAIVEEDESTTVIPSGAVATVDHYGSLIIKLAPRQTLQ